MRNEAKALADIIYVLQEEAGGKMRKQMAAYIQQVRDSEWEAMAHGLSDRGAEAELQHLGQALFGAEGRCPHHALYLVTTIHDSRNERLDSSDGSVPTALWLVLLAGALITLDYRHFSGRRISWDRT